MGSKWSAMFQCRQLGRFLHCISIRNSNRSLILGCLYRLHEFFASDFRNTILSAFRFKLDVACARLLRKLLSFTYLFKVFIPWFPSSSFFSFALLAASTLSGFRFDSLLETICVGFFSLSLQFFFFLHFDSLTHSVCVCLSFAPWTAHCLLLAFSEREIWMHFVIHSTRVRLFFYFLFFRTSETLSLCVRVFFFSSILSLQTHALMLGDCKDVVFS